MRTGKDDPAFHAAITACVLSLEPLSTRTASIFKSGALWIACVTDFSVALSESARFSVQMIKEMSVKVEPVLVRELSASSADWYISSVR